ncbi:MAG: SCO family protein [Rhizobiales bacterium]|nr:SCO family protein [Hyphomicrobiales bacterium]
MTARTTRVILILSAFVVGLALAFGVVMLVAGRGAGPITQASAVGGPFSLVDGGGKMVTDRDMKGKPFLVFFGFTHCPEICPTTLFEVSEVFRRLGPDADKAAALFITVDPERDTPAVMKDYLASFDPRLRGLTGDPEAIQAVLRSYRVYSKKVLLDGGGYTMDHTALVYLMDKEGRFVAPFNVKRGAEAAAADLRKYF